MNDHYDLSTLVCPSCKATGPFVLTPMGYGHLFGCASCGIDLPMRFTVRGPGHIFLGNAVVPQAAEHAARGLL